MFRSGLKLFRTFQICSSWIIRIRPLDFARAFRNAALRGVKSAPCRFNPPLLFGVTAYCLSVELPPDTSFDLLIDAVMRDDPDRIRQLMKAGADPDKRNKCGWTPLHSAAYHGKTELGFRLYFCSLLYE